MRILFVDDEASVLEGIENRLRKYRKRWDMNFSIGGSEALNLMQQQPFDAIISDMRMPEMDGAELLSRVRDNFEGTLRLILTGQTAKEQLFRSLSVAHRILNKPCDAQLLEEAIAEAQAIQNLITNTEVRKHLNKIESLPALPKLHNQLTEAIKSGEVDFDLVAKIIEQEPIVASRVLQMANSSFLGLARKISSIKEAVSLLGFDFVRGLVLNIELFCTFEQKPLSPSFSLQQFYQKSVLASKIVNQLTVETGNNEVAFSAALLHSLGQLVLAYAIPLEYEAILEAHKESDKSLVEIEFDLLGYTHADVSAYLLSLWNLPYPLIEAVGNYYKPSMTTPSNMSTTGLVHIASILAADVLKEKRSCAFDMTHMENYKLIDKIPVWKNELEGLDYDAQH